MGKFSLSLFFFFSSLAIPQFGLLSQVSSLRLSSGHSGPVLALSNVACTSLFSPRSLVGMQAWWVQASGLLFCWELQLGRTLWVLFIYFFLPVLLPSEIPKLPTDLAVRGFRLSFYLLYFALPPFEDSGLPFWVPGVLCQHSVVLWNLLSVQMIFQ